VGVAVCGVTVNVLCSDCLTDPSSGSSDRETAEDWLPCQLQGTSSGWSHCCGKALAVSVCHP
jgi:hypothetical protein